VHKQNANKHTVSFGVRLPAALVEDLDATRRRFRPDLPTRSAAIEEMVLAWIDAQRQPRDEP
jgi:metal-responsive CopG/Arc/MetJ family transcriptional regulator